MTTILQYDGLNNLALTPTEAFSMYDCNSQDNQIEAYLLLDLDMYLVSDGSRDVESTMWRNCADETGPDHACLQMSCH